MLDKLTLCLCFRACLCLAFRFVFGHNHASRHFFQVHLLYRSGDILFHNPNECEKWVQYFLQKWVFMNTIIVQYSATYGCCDY